VGGDRGLPADGRPTASAITIRHKSILIMAK
jgi:hypothetical protein